jgi:hypothetical protein
MKLSNEEIEKIVTDFFTDLDKPYEEVKEQLTADSIKLVVALITAINNIDNNLDSLIKHHFSV